MNLPKKLAYSFGTVASALSYQAFSTYVFFFYVDVIRLLPWLASIGMIVYGIWNALNDPIAGYISDITRTKWGRRIPYVLFGAVPFGLCFALVFLPPLGAENMMLLFVYFLVIINIHDTLYTVVTLNWASLFPEMFQSLKERAEVNSYRQFFQVIGYIIGIAVPPLIYSMYGWHAMGVALGFIIAGAFLVTLLGSKEKREFSVDPPLKFKEAIIYTIKNRSFLTFVAANIFVQYAFTVVLAAVPFYAKYVLRAPSSSIFYILISTFLVAVPMLFVWRQILHKIGPKSCFMASIVLFGLPLILFLFASSVPVAAISAGLVGIGLAGILLLWDIIISDIIDEDEINSGRRREGMYFGINALIVRLAIALQAITMGAVLTFTEYSPAMLFQKNVAIIGIRSLVSLFPIAGLVVAFFIMKYYPLAGERLEQVKAKVEKLHEEKARKIGAG